MEKKFYSVSEFLQVMGASRSWYEAAWRRGDIRRVQIGSRTFVPVNEPERIAALANTPTSSNEQRAN